MCRQQGICEAVASTHTTNPTLVLGIVVVMGSFALVHLARRSRLMRTKFTPTEDISFTRAQRTMHWAIALGSATLFVTGLPVYLSQFTVTPPVPTPLFFVYWGYYVFQWRNFHIYLALVVVGMVAAHSVLDVFGLRRFTSMRVSKADLGEAKRRSLAFLGMRDATFRQPTGRYDFFHRAYHWTLVALGAFLLVSGLLEWEAVQIGGVPVFVILDRINNTFMDGFIRTGHLVAAMLFAGLAVTHFYFAILPQNRPFLRSMALGKAPPSES